MKTNNALRFSVGALALLMALSPLSGFAKEIAGVKAQGLDAAVSLKIEKDSAKATSSAGKIKAEVKTHAVSASSTASVKSEKSAKPAKSENANKTDKSCLRAFGHLVAPGWIKKNGTTSVSADCWLPFGIGKKFNGTSTSGTSTPDVTAPVIASVSASPLQTSATVKWMTNEKSDSIVFYGTTSASVDVNSTTTAHVTKSGMVKDHSLNIANLSASTTYFFKVGSRDAAGNISYSDTMTFATKAADVVVTYPVISNVATIIGTSTASIAWKTNEPATTKVYYGTSTVDTNASSTTFVLNSTLVTNHAITIAGLATSTPYTFVIESRNAAGNATYSTSFTATTNSGL
jgi:hypothetical protein